MGPENLSTLVSNEFVRSTVFGVMFNLVLAALLSYWIGRVYVRCGRSLSNRKAFSQNFVLLTMTTMLVITIVQSNLAMSLGMIGALSIVRFRSAIKEPEELTFLFLCIAVGLGLGANQRLMTIGALSVVLGVVWIANSARRSQVQSDQNLFLTVTTNAPERLPLAARKWSGTPPGSNQSSPGRELLDVPDETRGSTGHRIGMQLYSQSREH